MDNTYRLLNRGLCFPWPAMARHGPMISIRPGLRLHLFADAQKPGDRFFVAARRGIVQPGRWPMWHGKIHQGLPSVTVEIIFFVNQLFDYHFQ